MKRKHYRAVLYILARIVGFILYPFPIRIGVQIGSILGKAAFYILPKERKKTLAHLKFAFGKEKTQREIKKIAINVFSNLGKNAVEWINFPKLDNGWFERYIIPEGVEHLGEARKKGKGIIILASHFGNWEWVSAYLNHIGYSGAIIARRIYIEQFDRFFVNMRENMGNKVIYRDESVKKVLRVLNNGGVIGILADQDVDSVEGVFVNFFGLPAYTPVAPVKLAMKTSAALIPVFVIREDGRFRFAVEREIELDITGDKERDTVTNTAKWTRVVERYIRRYPDQWVWMHRRWKTRPKDGDRSRDADGDRSHDADGDRSHDMTSI